MLKDYEYLDFETIKEDWNEYEIEDSTKLRIKFVMVKILRKKISEGYDYRFNSNNVISIHSPKIRPPGEKRYTPKELVNSIIKTDMTFKPIKEVWNKYLIKKDKSEIMAKIVIARIQKTDKYDEYGDPYYNIQAQPVFKANPPKKS